ncbi:hypothetical protein ACFQV4_23020 [Streptomyces thermocarboxydus]
MPPGGRGGRDRLRDARVRGRGLPLRGSVGQIVDTIADNAGCSGVVLGEERHPYGEVDLTQAEMVITGGGKEITRGVGSNVLGTR